jgi:predicted permease
MGTIGQDIRYAFRTLWHAPAFTLVVVLTLGLGIGANTAIFTLMDQVLLRALPVHDPASLVTLDSKGANMGRREGARTFSYPMFRQLRAGNEVFRGMLARYTASLTMLADNRAERVRGELVSGDFFQVLGLQPAHGRLLGPGDERTPGGHPVAVLSHAFFASRFGANPSTIGREIRLNGHPMTVVGVAPAGFSGVEVGDAPDLFVPLMMKAQMTPTYDGLHDARSMWLNVMGRLKPGVGRDRAKAALTVRFRQLRAQELKEMRATSPSFQKRFLEGELVLEPGYRGISALREQFSTPIVVLMSMVGLVLLIACANVANLLMARAPARQREIAIRLSLGASRGRIVRQLLVESLMLSLLGGAAGLLVAAWTADLLLEALPFERAVATLSSTPDARVLIFALAVSVMTGVLFGLVPAWQTARPQLIPALKEESGTVSVGGHVRLRKGLVIAQVALSLLLLVGAGLFARSLWNLRALDPGFRVEALTTFSVDPALSGYTAERSVHFYERLQERLRAIPGVIAVSMAAIVPLTDSMWMSTVNVEGYRRKEGEDVNPQVNSVGPGYFRTMGIPLVAGRDFTLADGPKAPKVAVVNEKMAQYFWGKENPIGRRFGWGDDEPDIEVVGVVRDGKQASLKDEVARLIYVPYPQDEELGALTGFVRSAGSEVSGAALRQAVRQIDAGVPVFEVRTMGRVADESLFFDRMVATLSAGFGALATLLAAVGLYGVMSYAVARRRREIGLRMALGAAPGSVIWSVMKEVSALTIIGIAVGVPASIAVSRLVQSQLFGVGAGDPATVVAASLLLLAVALFAGYVPAGQATRIDPVRALRAE